MFNAVLTTSFSMIINFYLHLFIFSKPKIRIGQITKNVSLFYCIFEIQYYKIFVFRDRMPLSLFKFSFIQILYWYYYLLWVGIVCGIMFSSHDGPEVTSPIVCKPPYVYDAEDNECGMFVFYIGNIKQKNKDSLKKILQKRKK